MRTHSSRMAERGLQRLTLPRLITLMFVLPLLAIAHFALAQTPAPATDPSSVKFDHVQTGFNLTGAHTQARCGSCHIQGVFKGTPRDCASCHITGNRMGAMAKPDTHIPTSAKCDSCHKTTVWTDATFSHIGLAPGSCLTCHNGTTASGKPNGHLPSTTSCDNCHQTTISWQQAVFSHDGIVSGCASCHNGQSFSGVTPVSKPTNHLATSASCETCHTSTSTFKSASGTSLPANHLPTTQSCGICHNSAGFNPGVMNHLGILSGCANCHNGQSFLGVTPLSKTSFPSHVATSADCSTCHSSTTTFLMANSTTPPAGHLPTTQACATCHSSFGPGSGVMSHTGILSGCASCHNGQSFTGVTPVSKPANHLPTSAGCETCHSASKFTSFSGTTMIHTGIVSGCASCHNGQAFSGVTPVSMPANHLPTSAACETCHSATKFTSFSGTSMNHAGIVNNCISCHNGQTFAVGLTPVNKSNYPTHMATSSDCSSCHSSTISFAGASPTVLPANHLPTTQVCSTCHGATFTIPGVMNHVGIVTNCITCHNGQTFAVGMTPVNKSSFPTHMSTSLDCSSCHSSTITFAGASATAMPTNHLPTTQACTLCHASGFGAGSGVMNHMGIVNNCATCHNGQSFAGVTPVSKPANHLPTSAACETCHSSSKFTSFSGTSMIHTGILSGCASCHNGQSFAGVTPVSKPANHLPTSAACETCHSASKFTSFSGTSMIHTGIVSGCANCHNGQSFTGVTPVAKPTNHLPTSATCETCHSVTAFTSFSGTAMNHAGIVNNCTLCHNGQVFAGVTPKSKPSNHIPYATSLTGGANMACEFCHTPTVFTAFTALVSSTAMHNGTQGNGSGWCKTCHASGTSYLGVTGDLKSVTHQSSTATDCSQSGCHRPLGSKGSSYTSWD